MEDQLRMSLAESLLLKSGLFSQGFTISTRMSSKSVSLRHRMKHELQVQPPDSTTSHRTLAKTRPNPFSFGTCSTRTSSISNILRQYVITIISIMLITTQVICQQNLCPKSCTCDEQNLETICRENGGFKASGIPHTLNPSIKRMIINNAQISQFMGLDSWLQLETLDLAFNRISMIDFKEISKNGKLISLNASHNNIIELKDSALLDKGITIVTLHDLEIDNFEHRSLAKINIVELILNHNNLTTLRNLTFLRWNKLQRLDLSYNYISWLDTYSLVGLNKLEMINLRSNRLTQIPALAFQNTFQSLNNWAHSSFSNTPSSIKILDLSENELTSIGADSFIMMSKLQELYLDSCSLQHLHEGAFNSLESLQTLSLDKNNLIDIPTQSFTNLILLKKISLNANNIINLRPNSFKGLFNLEELQLNNGSFKEITSRVFAKLNNLRILELGFNPNLTRIERGTFDHLPQLKYLGLNSNSLASVPNGFRDKTMTLDLRGNPLYCGCELRWLTKWLKQFDETARSEQFNAKASSEARNVSLSESDSNNSGARSDELINLKCAGPPALSDKLVMELVESKLECLEPTSELNVTIGFVVMVCITSIVVFICLFSFCRNKKHLFVMLKENLAQNHISMMLPYSQNLHKNVDDLKKETQLYGSDYEPIGCSQNPIYTVPPEQAIYYEPHSYSQYI